MRFGCVRPVFNELPALCPACRDPCFKDRLVFAHVFDVYEVALYVGIFSEDHEEFSLPVDR
ncbi:hypothetical protein D3C86_1955210 [compost metagenome]